MIFLVVFHEVFSTSVKKSWTFARYEQHSTELAYFFIREMFTYDDSMIDHHSTCQIPVNCQSQWLLTFQTTQEISVDSSQSPEIVYWRLSLIEDLLSSHETFLRSVEFRQCVSCKESSSSWFQVYLVMQICESNWHGCKQFCHLDQTNSESVAVCRSERDCCAYSSCFVFWRIAIVSWSRIVNPRYCWTWRCSWRVLRKRYVKQTSTWIW